MDIKKILDKIDGLREKADNSKPWERISDELGEEIYAGWENAGAAMVPTFYREGVEDVVGFAKYTADYVHALHNNYSSLRDYIARLERENEAGKNLYALCSKLTPERCADAEEALEHIIREAEAGKALAQYLMEGTLQEDDQMALSIYRSACEGEDK